MSCFMHSQGATYKHSCLFGLCTVIAMQSYALPKQDAQQTKKTSSVQTQPVKKASARVNMQVAYVNNTDVKTQLAGEWRGVGFRVPLTNSMYIQVDCETKKAEVQSDNTQLKEEFIRTGRAKDALENCANKKFNELTFSESVVEPNNRNILHLQVDAKLARRPNIMHFNTSLIQTKFEIKDEYLTIKNQQIGTWFRYKKRTH